jgi:hypothetical protein
MTDTTQQEREARIINELTTEEKTQAIRAYHAAHKVSPDLNFAPDRAWLEGYAHDRATPQGAEPVAVVTESQITGRKHLAFYSQQTMKAIKVGDHLYLAAPHPPEPKLSELRAVELSPEFTDTARAALLWVLWHHQGGNSQVGQPIRFALGMGQHDDLNDHQIREAKRWDELARQEGSAT